MHDLFLVLSQDVTGSFVSSLVLLGTSVQSMLMRAVLVLVKSLRLETQHQSTTLTHLIQCEHHPPDHRILQMPVLETKSRSICMTAVNVFSIR